MLSAGGLAPHSTFEDRNGEDALGSARRAALDSGAPRAGAEYPDASTMVS
jgi:hypothetical protein